MITIGGMPSGSSETASSTGRQRGRRRLTKMIVGTSSASVSTIAPNATSIEVMMLEPRPGWESAWEYAANESRPW